VTDQLSRDLAAFLAEHRDCGELDTGMTTKEPVRVWVTCSCGAHLERPADDSTDTEMNGPRPTR
jgi:hypothetical protein